MYSPMYNSQMMYPLPMPNYNPQMMYPPMYDPQMGQQQYMYNPQQMQTAGNPNLNNSQNNLQLQNQNVLPQFNSQQNMTPFMGGNPGQPMPNSQAGNFQNNAIPLNNSQGNSLAYSQINQTMQANDLGGSCPNPVSYPK